jgi:hypothetical protein
MNNLKRKQIGLITAWFLLFPGTIAHGQDESAREKDNSKPTNVYNQLDNYLELARYENYSIIGYIPELTYTPNENNAISLEMPLLYSFQTERSGLGDMRLRYFYIPYRDYSKTFGAFGASLDIIAPTGNFDSGIGSSSWQIAPGFTFGLMLNKSRTISAFPLISYIYTSKPSTEHIPESYKKEDHGLNVQIMTSFIINEDAFILVTPIYDIKDLKDEREDDYLLDIKAVFDIMKDRTQIGASYRGALNSKESIYRVFLTVFL